ncbi:CLUMA_CG015329, isoform A [Clunio marinus]|uniref:CLUMA_CG015329, isoform A n=1 Tax=Clunio marinus TaxID=568069 RepID=A0A1J1IQN8_9DIPT|nr:CLUMA_CG015329, isoform A [Clunio marinus]
MKMIWLIILSAWFIGYILIGFLVRCWTKFTNRHFESNNINLKGKTVLITGANNGLGKGVARFMANKGARVIMACRNMKTGKAVQDEIIRESGNDQIILLNVDLSSFRSIHEFCSKVIATETKIDILIHNAAYAGFIKKAVSADGIELTMATNHYGPFLMTTLLMDLLKKSAPRRIVVVTSKCHSVSYFTPQNEKHLNPIDCWLPLYQYSNSKLANLLFTFELARRLEGTGITVNALHPGTANSEIWQTESRIMNLSLYIFRKFLRSVNESIQTTLYVSLSKELENVTGKYFRNCKLGKTHKIAQNTSSQKILWKESEKIVNQINLGLTL